MNTTDPSKLTDEPYPKARIGAIATAPGGKVDMWPQQYHEVLEQQFLAGAKAERARALSKGGLTEEPTAAFQQRVQPWMMECFGPEISADVTERNHRFLEESLELVQSTGCTQSEAHQLVDYVYGRPVGDTPQEVGGVMVTLAALCLAKGLDMHAAGEVELARIWTKVDKIRAKQAAKPKHSPLPEAATSGAVVEQAPMTTEQIAHALAVAGINPDNYPDKANVEDIVRAVEAARGIGCTREASQPSAPQASSDFTEALSCFRKAAWERDHPEMMRWQLRIMEMARSASNATPTHSARFPMTYCSQCGKELGPGPCGISHCSDHATPEKLKAAWRSIAAPQGDDLHAAIRTLPERRHDWREFQHPQVAEHCYAMGFKECREAAAKLAIASSTPTQEQS